jgi:hypothetical protein
VAAAAGDTDDVAGVDVLTVVDVGLYKLVAVAGDDAAGVVDVDVPAAAGGQVGVTVAVAAPVAAGAGVDGVAPYPADSSRGGGVDQGAFARDQVDTVVARPVGAAGIPASLWRRRSPSRVPVSAVPARRR